MAAVPSTGSPSARGRTSVPFTIHEDKESKQKDTPTQSLQVNTTPKHGHSSSDSLTPLSNSKRENVHPQPTTEPGSKDTLSGNKHAKLVRGPAPTHEYKKPGAMDALLAKLSEQQALLAKQKTALSHGSDEENQPRETSSVGSTLLTPSSETFSPSNSDSDHGQGKIAEAEEMARLKKELDAAKDQIARQKQELDQSRVIKHTFDEAIAGPSNAAMSTLVDQFSNQSLSSNARQTWGSIEDTRSGVPDFHLASNMWSNNRAGSALQPDNTWQQGGRPWTQHGLHNVSTSVMSQQQPMQQRNYSVPLSSAPLSPVLGGGGRGMTEFNQFNTGRGYGGNRNANLFQQRGSGYGSYSGAISPSEALSPTSAFQSLAMYPSAYQPQPIGTPLSPTAAEFRTGQASANPWNAAPPSSPGQTYVSPMEPLNYRRLLDRSVTCNWKYIVDKIVCNNDQQASIFLQQKLKVGTVEQKYEIVEAIVAQAYPLMINRFGNFLVQRCFEHGTPEQVVAIANAIRGNTLSLSMDAFGCHVVQKAFDAVPEDYKAIMVHELLRRIPETVIHRYACHVWQKLFELRWSDSPPQIMKYVNEALRGMWHEVALGETGSLVVQNIFENCLEEDKRPCINEVLNSIDIVAHGQFGNWCIQHICEHGSPADRSQAIDHVLHYATEYSMDQFASKVVEKCLKIGGPEFLERYLERVCEGRSDRPRIPLIDIASDQYGNYLIQYILTNANPNHRDVVASHIRKHMVSLRGSKFGSRVGMLCCNPAYATHPGPGVGMPSNNRFSSAPTNIPRFGAGFR